MASPVHLNHAIVADADDVAERSNAVNSKLQLRRDQIEGLNQVSNSTGHKTN